MRRNVIETVMGAVVLAVAAYFLFFSYQSASVGKVQGYRVTAAFDRIDGLVVGGDVRIAGIKVGTVTGHRLDPQSYRAVVQMAISPDVEIPADSSAQIVSESLLGGKFMSIMPGADEAMLSDGGRIEYTQSPVNLEQLIGQFVFSSADSDGGGAGAGAGGMGN